MSEFDCTLFFSKIPLAPVIERFRNEAATAVARMVDERLEELVRTAAG